MTNLTHSARLITTTPMPPVEQGPDRRPATPVEGSAYYIVSEDLPAWLLVGHVHGADMAGPCRVLDPVYVQARLHPGDEVHVLPHGTYIILSEGTVAEGTLVRPHAASLERPLVPSPGHWQTVPDRDRLAPMTAAEASPFGLGQLIPLGLLDCRDTRLADAAPGNRARVILDVGSIATSSPSLVGRATSVEPNGS